MASNKTGLDNAGASAGNSLGKALIGILGVGVAGGAFLIGAAKTLGEALLDRQAYKAKRLEDRREADREAVRRITENEVE